MNEEKQFPFKQNLLLKSMVTGIVGAAILGIFSSMAYFMSISNVSHGTFIIRSFFSGGWTEGWTGELTSLAILSILGIVPALIYYFLFKKFSRVIHGMIYGAIWWTLFFVLLNQFFSYVPAIGQLNEDTIVATICQFVVYGVFVAYTISFDANDERITFQDQG